MLLLVASRYAHHSFAGIQVESANVLVPNISGI